MKRTYFSMLGMAFAIAALCACSSAPKTVADTADSYASGTEVKVPDGQAASPDVAKPEQKAAPKKQGTTWFTASTYVEEDEVKLYTTTVFNQLKLTKGIVVINPQKIIAGPRFYYQTNVFAIFMSDTVRAQFAESVKQYFDDFENKNLDRKGKKSYRVYGEYPCRVEWGTVISMMPNWSETHVQFGYEFKKNSPYFAMTIWNTENGAHKDGTSEQPDAGALHMYLTKAQAQALVDALTGPKLEADLNSYKSFSTEAAAPAATDAY